MGSSLPEQTPLVLSPLFRTQLLRMQPRITAVLTAPRTHQPVRPARQLLTALRTPAARRVFLLPPAPSSLLEHRDEPMGGHGLHDWWYGCLERAGVVAKGQTRGERMHKARHTAGQRVLDHTRGNLKATQKLLGHSSISTTADIYVDWDIDQLAETLREMLESES